MLEIGAVLIRTESELILKCRQVVPGRLLDDGFKFMFPYWRDGACALSGVEARERDRKFVDQTGVEPERNEILN